MLDSPESIQGLQFIQDLIYKYHVHPGPGDGAGIGDPTGIGPTDDIFKTGKIGMVYGRYKHATGIFKPIDAFDWSMTTFPKHPNQPRRTDMGINGFGIVNKSKSPDAAWQWIKWMTADEGNAKLLGNTSLPANKGVDAYKVSPLPKWQTDLTLDGLGNAWLLSPHPNVRQQMIDAMNEQLDLLYLNKSSGTEVGRAAAQLVNEVFQKLGPAVPR
jgi:multiple sugar transport system substrate-binding protein